MGLEGQRSPKREGVAGIMEEKKKKEGEEEKEKEKKKEK